uniref:Uncharacterized protein n=1 Tax=Anguilla anguilla TaxID=7936 RepID=A0A0E9Q0X0_ANGAN
MNGIITPILPRDTDIFPDRDASINGEHFGLPLIIYFSIPICYLEL